jgi:hypothetical protein
LGTCRIWINEQNTGQGNARRGKCLALKTLGTEEFGTENLGAETGGLSGLADRDQRALPAALPRPGT